jgi:hypothetical protein
MVRFISTTVPYPRSAIPLAALALSLLYLVGLDQGLLLSLVQGQSAFDLNLVHEFVHDARHAAGLPCH